MSQPSSCPIGRRPPAHYEIAHFTKAHVTAKHASLVDEDLRESDTGSRAKPSGSQRAGLGVDLPWRLQGVGRADLRFVHRTRGPDLRGAPDRGDRAPPPRRGHRLESRFRTTSRRSVNTSGPDRRRDDCCDGRGPLGTAFRRPSASGWRPPRSVLQADRTDQSPVVHIPAFGDGWRRTSQTQFWDTRGRSQPARW
jgi:hypothetical protein